MTEQEMAFKALVREAMIRKLGAVTFTPTAAAARRASSIMGKLKATAPKTPAPQPQAPAQKPPWASPGAHKRDLQE